MANSFEREWFGDKAQKVAPNIVSGLVVNTFRDFEDKFFGGDWSLVLIEYFRQGYGAIAKALGMNKSTVQMIVQRELAAAWTLRFEAERQVLQQNFAVDLFAWNVLPQ